MSTIPPTGSPFGFLEPLLRPLRRDLNHYDNAEGYLHRECHPTAGDSNSSSWRLGPSASNTTTTTTSSFSSALSTLSSPSLFSSHFDLTSPSTLAFSDWGLVCGTPAMNHDTSLQFLAARSRKRPHSEMSQSFSHRHHNHHNPRGQSPRRQYGEASSSSSPSSSSSSRRQALSSGLTLPPIRGLGLPVRYPGDGYDYRRPVASASSRRDEEVIDLTAEPDSPPLHRTQQREHNAGPRTLPRFGRQIMDDIVDLDDEDDEIEQPTYIESSSPEVEFVGETRQRPLRPPRDVRPNPRPRDFRSNLYNMLRRHLVGANPDQAAAREDAFRREVTLGTQNFARGGPRYDPADAIWIGDGREDVDLFVDPGLPLLDYQVAGFALDQAPRPPARATYKPPSPAPEGFTRNVKEDDVVVCPNCGDELGTGEGAKQQIWVVRQCGHVYCGDCTTNRSVTKARKAAASQHPRPPPFAKCPVADCGKPVSQPRAMFQIYL